MTRSFCIYLGFRGQRLCQLLGEVGTVPERLPAISEEHHSCPEHSECILTLHVMLRWNWVLRSSGVYWDIARRRNNGCRRCHSSLIAGSWKKLHESVRGLLQIS